jgi:hypothetical protein
MRAPVHIATRRGQGVRRLLAGFAFAAVVLPGPPPPAHAQLEVLLRGLDAVQPRVGACGRYRFAAEEPNGRRDVEFQACVERIEPGPDGSVFLHLSSGDSLNAWLEVAPALFAGHGGSLIQHVRSVLEVAGRDTTRLDRESLPGLDPAPPLPGARDSLLAPRDIQVGKHKLTARGRILHEESRSVRPLGDTQITQSIRRDVETWTADAAPILGIVRAAAVIRSERSLAKRVAGIPETGPKTWRYRLELIDILSSRRSRP